ncbi:MAG: tRNA (adenosine(37)-N6)-threonylcarbamoyltransferase complex dimerization subunit type 1 TsaB [Nitrospiraceae bacterium]|nr:MAG: tRNA (adenosine(37)-N6)-threonylcarbamoyltransferase complex dimerization subunit type 1 TsaB [Nitrospiraceae bacterium]
MKILAIETATIAGSIALYDDTSGIVGEVRINVKIAHAERLMPSIQWLLDSSRVSIDEVDVFAVSIGPGSFTGLRIGLSTVKGFAFATEKPVIAVPTLDAFARTIPYCIYQICPVLDARKDEVFTGLYRWEDNACKKIMPEKALSPERLIHEIKEQTLFTGDGITRYGDVIKEKCGDLALFPPPSKMSPSASTVAEIAYDKFNRGELSDPVSLTPFYIRKSEAELNWKK